MCVYMYVSLFVPVDVAVYIFGHDIGSPETEETGSGERTKRQPCRQAPPQQCHGGER